MTKTELLAFVTEALDQSEAFTVAVTRDAVEGPPPNSRGIFPGKSPGPKVQIVIECWVRRTKEKKLAVKP
jgi:hypothetical protein